MGTHEPDLCDLSVLALIKLVTEDCPHTHYHPVQRLDLHHFPQGPFLQLTCLHDDFLNICPKLFWPIVYANYHWISCFFHFTRFYMAHCPCWGNVYVYWRTGGILMLRLNIRLSRLGIWGFRISWLFVKCLPKFWLSSSWSGTSTTQKTLENPSLSLIYLSSWMEKAKTTPLPKLWEEISRVHPLYPPMRKITNSPDSFINFYLFLSLYVHCSYLIYFSISNTFS